MPDLDFTTQDSLYATHGLHAYAAKCPPKLVAFSRLKRSIGGVDDGLWNCLPNLAPGQAIVSAASMARPLLVAIDPTPSKLRIVE